LSAADLGVGAEPVTARLDCTSGWYADATWSGRRLSDLVDPARLAAAASLVVVSVTGYRRTFPVAAAPDLWLATSCQGRPLTAPTGAPVRLVAPGYRGFWWVKWVASVELSDAPAWRQLPFPPQ
jgi:DMSO/TMAO reductase YedYZ molybdopterin-dependent catalytic subunit